MRLEHTLRPLTGPERQRLEERLQDLRRSARAGALGPIAVAGAAAAVLWALTLLASDASWVVVTVFWAAAGALLALRVRHDQRSAGRALEAMAAQMESAVRRGEAEVYDIRARRYLAFEEVEDEGACWAFELGGGRVVFLTGQEMYAAPGFPSLDFSLVHPLDEGGRAADLWIEPRGEPVPPARVVPADVKLRLADALPGHLEVVSADLDRLEESLG